MNLHQQLEALCAPSSSLQLVNLIYLQSEAQSCHLLFISGTGEGFTDLTEVGSDYRVLTYRIGVKARHDPQQARGSLISRADNLEKINFIIQE